MTLNNLHIRVQTDLGTNIVNSFFCGVKNEFFCFSRNLDQSKEAQGTWERFPLDIGNDVERNNNDYKHHCRNSSSGSSGYSTTTEDFIDSSRDSVDGIDIVDGVRFVDEIVDGKSVKTT